MSRFEHTATGVVVTVADHKDERFGTDWKRLPAFGAEPAPAPAPAPEPDPAAKRSPGRPRNTK